MTSILKLQRLFITTNEKNIYIINKIKIYIFNHISANLSYLSKIYFFIITIKCQITHLNNSPFFIYFFSFDAQNHITHISKCDSKLNFIHYRRKLCARCLSSLLKITADFEPRYLGEKKR